MARLPVQSWAALAALALVLALVAVASRAVSAVRANDRLAAALAASEFRAAALRGQVEYYRKWKNEEAEEREYYFRLALAKGGK